MNSKRRMKSCNSNEQNNTFQIDRTHNKNHAE